MVGYLAIALATVWTALVVETIVESTGTDDTSIVVFRTDLLSVGSRPGILILCGLAASAGVALVAAVAFARGRRVERQMAEALDARSEELTTRAAGDMARAGLVSWRVDELRASMDELSAQRDAILAEMEQAKRRTAELRALADDYKRSVSELQERLIVLPDLEDELARRRSQRQVADPAP